MQESFGYHGPEPLGTREEEVGAIDRAYARFEDRVTQLSGLSPEKARTATAFVLHALEYRMDGKAIKHFEDALPPGVDVLLQRNRMQDDDFTGFHRATFFQDIARKLDLRTEQAGAVVAGVLTGVREWMDPDEAESLAAALPEDLRALWRRPNRKFFSAPPSPAQIARHEAHYSQAYQRLIHDLQRSSGLETSLAECGLAAVLCQLDARLMGEGPDLKAQLPKRLQDMLVECNKPMQRPDKFDLDELFARVAADLRIEVEAAVPIVAAVFHAVKNRISPGEAEQVADQLPKDIAGAWLCA